MPFLDRYNNIRVHCRRGGFLSLFKRFRPSDEIVYNYLGRVSPPNFPELNCSCLGMNHESTEGLCAREENL